MTLRSFAPLATLDLRSLAAFRIALAGVVLLDLALRASDLTAHYSGLGVLPLAELGPHAFGWTALHRIDDGVTFQAGVFALHALLALALLVGLRTRVVTVLCWLMALSLQSRNPLVESGGDTLLRILLLLSIFCPLGARFSVDAWAHGRPAETAHRSLGTLVLMLQVALVLFMTGVLKTYSPDWTQTGEALYYALHARPTAIGGLVLLLPTGLLRIATHGSHALELATPFLLFCPFRTERVRLVVVPFAIAFLLMVWLTLDVGILPLLEGLSLLVFLPGDAFERLARVGAPSAPRWLQRLSAPAPLRLGIAARVACVLLLVDIAGYNLASLPGRPLPPLVLLPPLAHGLGLNQRWPMFTAPSHRVAWTAVVGSTPAGEVMLNALADDLEMAEDPRGRAHPAHGYRWLKLFESLLEEGDERRWQRVASVLCRAWRASSSRFDGPHSIALYAATQDILPDYRYGPIRLHPLARENCAR